MPAIDLATLKVAPFESTPQDDALSAFAGDWEGPTQTWFQPGTPVDRSKTRLHVELLLGGRFLRVVNAGNTTGSPHGGELLIGYEPKENVYTGVYIDSFHMSRGFLISKGAPRDDGIIVILGSFAAGSESWGWRTELRREGALLIHDAYLITPKGEEHHAVESRLSKVGGTKRGGSKSKPAAKRGARKAATKRTGAKKAARPAAKRAKAKSASKRGRAAKRR